MEKPIEIKLNLGSGAIGQLRKPGYDGVDKQDFGQKYVFSALEIDKHFKPDSVDEIVADMFLEHLTYEEAVELLNKIWVILKPGKLFKIEGPSVSRGKAYEFTHRSWYTEDTFGEIDNEEMCCECGLKPFKVVELFTNAKGNIYCDLMKTDKYTIPLRKKL